MKAVITMLSTICICSCATADWAAVTRSTLAATSKATVLAWEVTRSAMDKKCGPIAEMCGAAGDLDCPDLVVCKQEHAVYGQIVSSIHEAIGAAVVGVAAVEAAVARCDVGDDADDDEKKACESLISAKRAEAIMLVAMALKAMDGLRSRLAKNGVRWEL